jgi:hypothetical protein
MLDGKEYDLGHMWVQHAETLEALSLAFGTRLKMTCRVTQYFKRHEGGTVAAYGLRLPSDVEILYAPPTPVRPPEPPPPVVVEPPAKAEPAPPAVEKVQAAEPAEPLKLLRDVKELARRAGGFAALRELIDVLE